MGINTPAADTMPPRAPTRYVDGKPRTLRLNDDATDLDTHSDSTGDAP